MRRFVLLFLFYTSVGFALIYVHPVTLGSDALDAAMARISGVLIHLAGGHVDVAGKSLKVPGKGFAIAVEKGCDGINVVVLLWSAMLAWPAVLSAKLKGMLLGALVIETANLIRLITLFYLGQWNTGWFEWMHLYVWEVLIMLFGLAVFSVWIHQTLRSAGRNPAK